MEPMISVVIPMFNAEKYVREAVESVLNQTVGNLEVLVVDDCSTDQSAQAVEDLIANRNGGGLCACFVTRRTPVLPSLATLPSMRLAASTLPASMPTTFSFPTRSRFC
ncbi:MAG: glycosyltransferase [Selenomonadaceae bacterium]|nr:glycosyltransferase [Selenomonadaceae bacterium]